MQVPINGYIAMLNRLMIFIHQIMADISIRNATEKVKDIARHSPKTATFPPNPMIFNALVEGVPVVIG